jgi:hypothetical protein
VISRAALTKAKRRAEVFLAQQMKLPWPFFLNFQFAQVSVPFRRHTSGSGELLRSVEKLRDEAQRNGNINWDEGFELLLEFLRDKLLDPSVFDEAKIVETEKILVRFNDHKAPYVSSDYYDELSDRVVEYFRYHGSLFHPKNLTLRR